MENKKVPEGTIIKTKNEVSWIQKVNVPKVLFEFNNLRKTKEEKMKRTAKPLVTVRERERESKDLKNQIVLISVAEKLKRNINVINKDSLLHSKTRINTCFVM